MAKTTRMTPNRMITPRKSKRIMRKLRTQTDVVTMTVPYLHRRSERLMKRNGQTSPRKMRLRSSRSETRSETPSRTSSLSLTRPKSKPKVQKSKPKYKSRGKVSAKLATKVQPHRNCKFTTQDDWSDRTSTVTTTTMPRLERQLDSTGSTGSPSYDTGSGTSDARSNRNARRIVTLSRSGSDSAQFITEQRSAPPSNATGDSSVTRVDGMLDDFKNENGKFLTTSFPDFSEETLRNNLPEVGQNARNMPSCSGSNNEGGSECSGAGNSLGDLLNFEIRSSDEEILYRLARNGSQPRPGINEADDGSADLLPILPYDNIHAGLPIGDGNGVNGVEGNIEMTAVDAGVPVGVENGNNDAPENIEMNNIGPAAAVRVENPADENDDPVHIEMNENNDNEAGTSSRQNNNVHGVPQDGQGPRAKSNGKHNPERINAIGSLMTNLSYLFHDSVIGATVEEWGQSRKNHPVFRLGHLECFSVSLFKELKGLVAPVSAREMVQKKMQGWYKDIKKERGDNEGLD